MRQGEPIRADQAAGVGWAAAACDLLRSNEAEQLAFLTDTRAVHAVFLAGTAAAGTYRGTPGSGVEHARRAVLLPHRVPGLRLRDPCAPPDQVAAAMADFALRISGIWHDRAGGFDALARVCHGFLAIHPYMDGNGRICRTMLTLLALRIGLWPRPGWRVHPRPYDQTMSLCLQWYPDHPALLACHLRQWFDDRPDNAITARTGSLPRRP